MKHINEFDASNNSQRRRARRKGIKVKVGNAIVVIYFDDDAGNRKPYRVLWYAADGTKSCEMFATLDEARTFAEKTATDLNNGQRPHTKEEIDQLFELDARVKAQNEQLASIGRTVDQVVADVLAAAEILPGWTCAQMAQEIRARHATIKHYLSTAEAGDAYLAHVLGCYKRQYSLNYLTQQKTMVGAFKHAFKGRRLDLIAPREIRDYISAMRVNPRSRHDASIPRDSAGLIPASQKTKDAVYNCLSGLFRFARDVAEALPAEQRTAVERVGRPDEVTRIPQTYAPSDLAALFQVLPDVEMVLFVAVQVFAGLRPCEAIDLADDDFLPDEHGALAQILVRHHIAKKSAGPKAQVRTRKAPITAPLAALLKVITLPKGRLFRRSNLQAYALEYLRQAGVTPKHDSFRHTWVSYRLADLQNRDQVAYEAGHTTTVQMDAYEGLVLPKDVRPYWACVLVVVNLPWQPELRLRLADPPLTWNKQTHEIAAGYMRVSPRKCNL